MEDAKRTESAQVVGARGAARRDDDRHVRESGMLAHAGEYLDTVYPWQHQIEHQEIRWLFKFEQPDGFPSVFGRTDDDAAAREHAVQVLADCVVVLHDEDASTG